VAAGFLGSLAEQQTETEDALRLALAYAMVMASFAIQAFGVQRLQRLTRADVEERLATMAWQTEPAG
jgi:fructose-1-phosphate kinase PfkB-like protein